MESGWEYVKHVARLSLKARELGYDEKERNKVKVFYDVVVSGMGDAVERNASRVMDIPVYSDGSHLEFIAKSLKKNAAKREILDELRTQEGFEAMKALYLQVAQSLE